MAFRAREAAKFLAGFAFNETMGHWWLGLWGGDHLPWKVGSYVFTKDMNTAAMVIWPVACVALAWWGWRRRQAIGSPRPGPATV